MQRYVWYTYVQFEKIKGKGDIKMYITNSQLHMVARATAHRGPRPLSLS